jgi:hypothetical protein
MELNASLEVDGWIRAGITQNFTSERDKNQPNVMVLRCECYRTGTNLELLKRQ